MYYLFDKDLNIICPIETYKSLIWATRYYDSDDFELYIPVSQYMLEVLRKDYYIARDTDEFSEPMIIEDIQISTDAEQGNYLIVTGRSLKSILSRRIIWGQTTVTGKVFTCIRRLVNDNAVNPVDSARKISRLKLADESEGANIASTMTAQFAAGDNLETVVQDICKTYRLGYVVTLDVKRKEFVFHIYEGTNRSYSQTSQIPVVFSYEYENLLSTNYKRSTKNYKNVALVLGEGEGVDQKRTSVGSASDLERYEMLVDASNISSNDGEITDVDYYAALSEQGKESLYENSATTSMDGEIALDHTFVLNRDYFLGDIVEVINEYGIEMTPRIVEIIESDDDTGHYVIPTFSTD